MNQDTILKANYNSDYGVVNATEMYFNEPRYNFESELQHAASDYSRVRRMYFNEPRYNFESELQLVASKSASSTGCISMNQDTILKANYNYHGADLHLNLDVFQ